MSKKLVKVSFSSKWELAEALKAGRQFLVPNSPVPLRLYYSEATGYSPFRYKADGAVSEGSMSTSWDFFQCLQEEVEVPWYEAIPEQGVLCWVSDTNPQPAEGDPMETVYVYDSTATNREFRCKTQGGNYYGWRFAIPVTAEELAPRILKEGCDV